MCVPHLIGVSEGLCGRGLLFAPGFSNFQDVMRNRLYKIFAMNLLIAALGTQAALAQAMLKITIPRRSRLTPVQRLNREGVKAVDEHNYAKAEEAFYKAYLYDPADPFTLNNLGYISELKGQLERADEFYKLAAEQGSNANIDLSNVKDLEGKPMMAAFAGVREKKMEVNRMNVEAMRLLKDDRGFEAIALLKQALKLDAENPFTENNLGVANEAVGDFADALRYYNQAAQSNISERVAITQDAAWNGKPVSAAAAANATRLEGLMQRAGTAEEQAAMYNLRGVYAANENDAGTAKADFLQAYKLDPGNAFSLNNRGYVAEMNGDLESAQFFYEKAQQATGSTARVGLATTNSAEGQPLFRAAEDSNQKVDNALAIYTGKQRQQKAPIVLTPRGAALSGNAPAGRAQPQTPEVPKSPASQPPLD